MLALTVAAAKQAAQQCGAWCNLKLQAKKAAFREECGLEAGEQYRPKPVMLLSLAYSALADALTLVSAVAVGTESVASTSTSVLLSVSVPFRY